MAADVKEMYHQFEDSVWIKVCTIQSELYYEAKC